ncbi:MAG: fibronectin type III domain-containing protein, partial [Chloroflexi bacterium]|nr:fibronectin type III domain-containing protein [Chloroflexota bacterium]
RYPGWFDLACSQTPPAESGDVPPIVFDNSLTCPDILGGVSWQVGLRFDSNFAPEDALDPVDPPQYKGKIAIAHSAMGRDRVNVPISMEVLSAPLPERPENPSFTVAAGSPLGYSGADILMLATTPGFTATLAIPAANLGLAFEDDIDALSYGLDGSGANGGAEFACLDFEDLTLGTTYHVTDTFVTSGITVTATAFQWSGGAWTSDGFAEVENGGLAGGSGQEMEVNNINLEFDFGGSISGLELRFGEYGGNLNVEINGDFQNFGNFADIHGSTIGGVNVSVVNGLGNDQGMLTLEGAIDSFAIGGQELWIDDVCPPEEEEENGEVLNFSVQPGAAGRPGTAVEAEAACDPAEAAGDEFVVTIPGQNEQVLDEDGNACGANAGYPLGLTLDDNLDALNGQPPEHIYDPDEPVYFSLTSGSPSLSVLGATEADILVNQAYTTSIFASGEELGLQAGDDVDAMMLLENGNGYFDPATAEYPDGDRLVFSLAAGSTTLTDLGRSSAALLVPNKGTPGGPPAVAFPALLSGLAFEDDLNALKGDAYFLWRLAPFPEEPPTPEPSGCEVNPIGGPEGWNSRTSLPVGREGGFAVIIGNRIYVGQGLSAFGDDSFHFIYHIPTDTWHWAAPAPIGRAEVTGVCAEEEEQGQVQGKVFVFGGRSGGAVLDNVLVYDPLTDSWSARAPMPTPRVGMGAAWAPPQNPGDPSLIYVIGGRDGTIPHSGTPMDVVEAYDVVSGTWSTMAPMPVPMMDVYSTVYYSDTHKIYVIGGYDGSNVSGKVQIYDVGSDSWSTGASMPTPRSNLLAGLCEGRIHAIGGYDGTNEFAVNEAYDPSTNTWSTAGISPLPEPRSEFMTQGIFTGQDIYAIGDGIHGVGGGPHDVYTCGTAEPPVISDVRITNVRDTSFTVSWITDISSDGHVNYGTDPANLNQTAYDDRGADTFDDTHHVTLQELLPNTLYYFDVVSGATTDDNDGAHYTVTTGPTLGLPGSDQIFGQVFKEDGTTPAEGAIVYITLRDADGSGSPDEAATLSALVDDTGYWTTNLGNARLADLSGYFTYSASGDQVKLEAQGAAGGTGCLLVDTADDSPAADLILNVSTCLVEKEIPLQIGWNHISLPLDPLTSYTAEGVCDEIISQGGDVAEIDRWYASGWDGHICGLPFNDFDLELGSDYFIRSNAASTWSIEGYSVTTPVPLDLQIGWNSIGVPHCDTYTAESLCEEIIGQGVTAIEIDRWYASGWDGHICGLPFNDFPIEIGKGYFVKAASAGLVTPTCPALSTLASPLALAQEAPLAARKAQVRIENVQMTNLRDTSFAVSWTTDRKATGYLEFADGRVVYDVRGKGFAGETHYVVVTGLTPKTTYLFDIDSGATLDDKAGKHHTITTLPTLDTLPDSDVVYGQVFLSDGVPNEFGLTLAEGAIVYLTLADRDGQGSAGEAAVMSALVDAGGWWQANLGNARLADGSDVFAYSAFGDVVTLAAQGTGVGLVIQTMDTGDLRPAAPLSPDWQFQTYLPLIGR